MNMADLTESTKSFWSRPEGKTGIIALLGLGALAVWGWSAIVGFILSMLVNTFLTIVLAVGVIVLLLVAISPRTHMIFRLLARAITGLIINIDPIGILQDRLNTIKKRRAKMSEQISQVSGQVRLLKDTIAKNKAEADKSMGEAAYAHDKATSATDEISKLSMASQVKIKANRAGRLQKANVSYQQLLTKLQSLYDLLQKWSIHLDTYIADTEDEVKQKKIEYKTINTAYSAFKGAMKAFKGSVTEEDIYDTTMEHLAENASLKLGEIEDFQRITANFMDNLDVENGAVTEKAMKELEAYQQRLLLPESQAFLRTTPSSKDTIEGNYVELFKKGG